jgi:hypothetical protein
MLPDLHGRVKEWAARQGDRPGFSEAIRRLIECGLLEEGETGSRLLSRKLIARRERLAKARWLCERLSKMLDELEAL